MKSLRSDLAAALLPALLCLFLLLQASLPSSFSGVYFGGWLYVAAAASVAASGMLYYSGRHLWMFAPLASYLIMSGAIVGIGGYGYPFEGQSIWAGSPASNASIHSAARLFSMSSLVSVFVSLALIFALSKRQFKYLQCLLVASGVFTALSIHYEHFILGNDVGWKLIIFDNPGTAALFATFGALLGTDLIRVSEVITSKGKRIGVAALWLVVGGALALVGASTPIMAAGAGLLFLGLREASPKWIVLTLSLLALAAFFFFPSMEAVEKDGSGRFDFWRAAYDYWIQSDTRMLVGTGLGTSKILGPLLTRQGLFWWHSDILQCLFELGIVGSLCAVVAVFRVLYGLLTNDVLVGLGIGFLVATATAFPVHLPAHAIFLLVLIRSSL